LQINQQKGVDGLPEIRKAFEFMVDKIGADIASGPLWQEYIAFLEVCCCLKASAALGGLSQA
jgi:cleavage stimulation factor subunit 3